MDRINLGSKEIISCLLSDRLQNITVIPSADFKVVTEDEATTVVNWSVVENIAGMRVDSLIDTTVGTWAEGVYKLYVRASIPPEAPIVGPFEFGVS